MADTLIPTPLNKRSVRAAFGRAATSYDSAAVLQREVADRLIERLDLVKLDPECILDVGSGTGYCTRALTRRFPKARVLGMDIAPAMTAAAAHCGRRFFFWPGQGLRPRYVCGDAEFLPFAARSVDLVISNLTLQWCHPDSAFAEFARVLRPGGLLMFTSFGPDTLRELRAAWFSVDKAAHVHDFIDMHDLGDALLRARFAEPVMDVERLTLTYAKVHDVLRDLKAVGAHNAALARPTGLTGKRRFADFRVAYEAMALADGRIPASYEVVHGHAWAREQQTDDRPTLGGVVAVPLTQFKRRGL